MRIAMVFDGLQIGGIERVGADYAKILADAGYDVTIINLKPKLVEMEKEFPSSCNIVHLDYSRKMVPEQYNKAIRIWSWGKFFYPFMAIILKPLNCVIKFKCRTMGMLLNDYDLAIAFSGHFNDLNFVANNFVRANQKICWLHGTLYSYLLISDGFLNLYKKIRNLIVLVDVGQQEVLAYNKYLDLNIHKLYNPTFISDKKVSEENVLNLKKTYGKFILMISRFASPKDPYTLIDAFSIVMEKHKDLNLVFVGDGPDKVKAIEYAKSKGENIAKHIFFEGTRFNVQDYYSSAFLLVQSSEFEGLPTTIIEALYFNLPVISTDCPSGPREILGHSEYGLLCRVNDANDMARQIRLMCEDEELYNQYKMKGSQRSLEFMPSTIKHKLSNIIESIKEGFK